MGSKLKHAVNGSVAGFKSADTADITHLKAHFLPIQEGTGDPSPTNIRNISGWTGLNVFKTKKNIANFTSLEQGAYDPNNGGAPADGSKTIRTVDYAFVKKGNKYTFNASGVNVAWVLIYDVNKNYIGSSGGWGSLPFTITFTDDAYIRLMFGKRVDNSRVIITPEDASEIRVYANGYYASDPYEPYSGSIFPISWSSSGSVCGGYVDLITGEVFATYACYGLAWKYWEFGAVVGDNTRKTFSIGYSPYMYPIFDGGTIKTTASICNVSNTYLNSNSSDTVHYYINSTGKVIYATLPNDFDEDTIVQVASVLASPILITTLTPQQLKAFKGQNNIWSDANENTEVEYEFTDYLNKRRISLNEPHIVTKTNLISSFNTDLAAPIKHLKAYFGSMQDGTGDPSPNNVRPIRGRTNLKVWQYAENSLLISNSSYTGNGISFTVVYDSDSVKRAIKVKGTRESSNTFYTLNYGGRGVLPFPPGTYKVEGYTSNIGFRVFIYDSNGTEVCVMRTDQGQNQFTIPSDATASWIRLQVNTDNYVNEVIYPVVVKIDDPLITLSASWSSFGTLYGGYVDLITGEIVAEWCSHTFDGSERIKISTTFTGTNGQRYDTNAMDFAKPQDNTAISDKAKALTSNPATVTELSFRSGGGEWRTMFFVPDDLFEGENNAVNFANWLSENNVTIVEHYETPVIVSSLTPQQLKAFKGQNNIWSDGGGNTSVSYWTHK